MNVRAAVMALCVLWCGVSSDADAARLDTGLSAQSFGTRAIDLDDLVPEPGQISTGGAWLAFETDAGWRFESKWLFTGSLENYLGGIPGPGAGGVAGRLRERVTGGEAWVECRAGRQGNLSVFGGLGTSYLDADCRLDAASPTISTRSIERSVGVRLRTNVSLPWRLGASAWWSNGWTNGTGDNRSTGARYEWQGLSWSAGLSLGVGLWEMAEP